MKWTPRERERKPRPKAGDIKIGTRFLLFPKKLKVVDEWGAKEEVRWLCLTKITYKRRDGVSYTAQNAFGATWDERTADNWQPVCWSES